MPAHSSGRRPLTAAQLHFLPRPSPSLPASPSSGAWSPAPTVAHSAVMCQSGCGPCPCAEQVPPRSLLPPCRRQHPSTTFTAFPRHPWHPSPYLQHACDVGGVVVRTPFTDGETGYAVPQAPAADMEDPGPTQDLQQLLAHYPGGGASLTFLRSQTQRSWDRGGELCGTCPGGRAGEAGEKEGTGVPVRPQARHLWLHKLTHLSQ